MSTYGLWLSAAGMKMNDYSQTVLTNNVANADTTGFKYDLAVFTQRSIESRENPGQPGLSAPGLAGLSGGVHVRPSYISFAQGGIERTGRPLDVAIRGEGFFTVSDGEVTRYTRDGEFARNTTGELVLAAGGGRWRVLSDGGSPILLSEEGGPASIGADGTVRVGETVIAVLGVAKPEDQTRLRKVGENLFEPVDTTMQPVEANLAAGSRESSNFDIMKGLASMIAVSRAYQLNATMIQLQDQLSAQAVSRIARVA
ncbi:MAG: flagellar hook-basal body protein [Planctomycetes bacterium]|nr:flagellar hook-basal body protein [Planctomycetota bacterium]